jgi:replicative DNA helicase
LVSLKESGDLEYSADTALFLVEADKPQPEPPARAVDLVVEKNRYGPKGRIPLIFRPELGVFREAERA